MSWAGGALVEVGLIVALDAGGADNPATLCAVRVTGADCDNDGRYDEECYKKIHAIFIKYLW